MAVLRAPSNACTGRSRALLRLVAAAMASVVSQAPAAHAQTGDPAPVEYAVKANYLYKFGPFVEWPTRAYASAASPFQVCVFGHDPFGPALDQAVKGQTVDGRPVAVRRLRSVGGDVDCQVLYVGRSPTQSSADALKAVQGAPVLTVTDDGQGVGGGMVHFLLRAGRVRFALDVSAAQASGLAISSKLQGLAVPLPGSPK